MHSKAAGDEVGAFRINKENKRYSEFMKQNSSLW